MHTLTPTQWQPLWTKKIDQVNPTLLGGFCFIFNENDTKITVKASAISGLESIYVNDKFMSKKRAFTKSSRHTFHLDDIEYQILFETEVLKGQVTCTFFKNGKIIKSYTALPKGNHYIKSSLYALIGFVFGILIKYGISQHRINKIYIYNTPKLNPFSQHHPFFYLHYQYAQRLLR